MFFLNKHNNTTLLVVFRVINLVHSFEERLDMEH